MKIERVNTRGGKNSKKGEIVEVCNDNGMMIFKDDKGGAVLFGAGNPYKVTLSAKEVAELAG